jgi:hypothetical protein
MTAAADPHDEIDLNAGWRRLVVRSHLPAVLRRHMRAERQFLAAMLAPGGYDVVIEAGCADGSLLLSTVVAAGCDYLGVDVVDQAVATTRKTIASMQLAAGQRATAVRGDVRSLDEVAGVMDVADRALVVMPFNLVGIVSRPEAAFRSAAAIGADIAVFTYRQTPLASAARSEYFRRAGWPGVETVTPDATHFHADHFTSSVYAATRLRAWLTANTFKPTITLYGEVGLAAVGRLS